MYIAVVQDDCGTMLSTTFPALQKLRFSECLLEPNFLPMLAACEVQLSSLSLDFCGFRGADGFSRMVQVFGDGSFRKLQSLNLCLGLDRGEIWRELDLTNLRHLKSLKHLTIRCCIPTNINKMLSEIPLQELTGVSCLPPDTRLVSQTLQTIYIGQLRLSQHGQMMCRDDLPALQSVVFDNVHITDADADLTQLRSNVIKIAGLPLSPNEGDIKFGEDFCVNFDSELNAHQIRSILHALVDSSLPSAFSNLKRVDVNCRVGHGMAQLVSRLFTGCENIAFEGFDCENGIVELVKSMPSLRVLSCTPFKTSDCLPSIFAALLTKHNMGRGSFELSLCAYDLEIKAQLQCISQQWDLAKQELGHSDVRMDIWDSHRLQFQ